MATLDGFPASFYGEPGVLGMVANGISAFMVLLQNFNTARTGVSAEGVENILAGVHLILIDGVCQLIAGLLSFRKYDHLSGTAFIGYAALWGSYGATRIFLDILCLFYLTNGVAALSALHTASSSQSVTFLQLSVPCVLVSGAVVQGFVSRLQVRGGQRFGSVIPSFYLSVWATWTWYRFTGPLLQISPVGSYGFTAGAIAFLVINAFLVLIAAYGNLVLLSLTVVMEAVLVCFLLSTLQQLPYQLEIAMLAVFSVICLYGTLASLVNSTFRPSVMPMGPPLVKDVNEQQKFSPALPCPMADSRGTSGLLKISRLLDDGGVCGIPTDTVYALAASCKNPQAIENIYNIKDRPAEKPICICISSVEQLVAAKPPFRPLLWEFMRNVYPGGISCIISKGDWLLRLGVGPAYDHVGTNDSIMIRVPDHTVTGHLCDITGPLAITSANPSGEPDSTHHGMVISRLGHKIQGVLCDGDSNEVVASTVVNCLKIDEGTIRIVREGCVPAVKVRQIFERVKTSML
uniref:Threonylcarbamoyl-AMP synthase n=1 Tax=Salmo trutta TaxID=8032 RepID=A0A674CYF0_SALTR